MLVGMLYSFTNYIYQYNCAYVVGQPFIIPYNLPPHLAAKMYQASAAFRMFDRNWSGSLDKREWKHCLRHLGFSIHSTVIPRACIVLYMDLSYHLSCPKTYISIDSYNIFLKAKESIGSEWWTEIAQEGYQRESSVSGGCK